MERVLETVNNTLNAYFKMNGQVGNEKQTSLKQIKDMMSEKWSALVNDWIPAYAEECPMDKCYNEELPSFYNNEKQINTSIKTTEEIVNIDESETETLEVNVPQKKL
ncbi:MAG: hypothetical protein IKE75_00655 [Bacilli bacterium]|nr:hypothetical protein [Bacilli bacterium]